MCVNTCSKLGPDQNRHWSYGGSHSESDIATTAAAPAPAAPATNAMFGGGNTRTPALDTDVDTPKDGELSSRARIFCQLYFWAASRPGMTEAAGCPVLVRLDFLTNPASQGPPLKYTSRRVAEATKPGRTGYNALLSPF